MKSFLLSLLFLQFSIFSIAQEIESLTPLDPAETFDSLYNYQQIEIDSILSVRLPYNFTQNSKVSEGFYSDYWMANAQNGMTFIVHRARMEERVCLANKITLNTYYDTAVDEWLASEENLSDIKSIKENQFDVLLANVSYNQYDLEEDEMMHSDYRIIQIKETFYQLGILQSVATKEDSINDLFFSSIKINPEYTKKNQYTECGTMDLLFNTQEQKKTGNEAYDTGYAMAPYLLGFICIGTFLALIWLIVSLTVKKNKKKSQQEWDEFKLSSTHKCNNHII